MREYFRHARAVHRAAMRALEASEGRHSGRCSRSSATGARGSPTPSSASRANGSTSAPQRLETDPELALRLFEFVARHGVRLAADTEQRLAEQLPALRE